MEWHRNRPRPHLLRERKGARFCASKMGIGEGNVAMSFGSNCTENKVEWHRNSRRIKWSGTVIPVIPETQFG
jgi:hypothetical protein